ncbi:hypothetical protein H0H92_010288 [Tricholoma furcatifolium]|nr:hypothetical protein H0H92_010288 [Tricholoma furcatifolium]
MVGTFNCAVVSAEEEIGPVMVNEYIIPFDPSKLKKPDQEIHAFITEENEGKPAESAEKPPSRKGVQTKKKYKPVAKKTKPVATTVSEEFRVVRKNVGDPLAGMPPLNPNPPPFKPGKRFTQERMEKFVEDHDTGFLTKAEIAVP